MTRNRRAILNIVLIGLLIPSSISLPTLARAATSVAFTKTRLAGVSLSVVTIDLNNANVRVTPVIARRGIGTSESFRSIIRRTHPAAAINGTFFCTHSLKPTGDIVIGRQLLWKGCLGTAVGINPNNEVTFVASRHRDLYNWRDFDDVLVAGPTLISRGRTIVVPRAEGFKSGVHFSKHARAAVGLTYAHKLVFVTTRQPIYLSQLARAMKRLKCVDAATLDGGSSTGLYWKGKLITNPSRGMTNCLLVYDSPYRFEQSRGFLCPNPGLTSVPTAGT